ncbi:hypothetical protein [Fusobacterium sp.]|uniref:hypothetical protein n=1 Tax=Fusobacterium sp. TaxID=68766 RepID=UPI00262C074F|nr:hypothetical protein [Fusobacterium sp.]
MKTKKIIFILIFFCFIKTYSKIEIENVSDSYIQINVKNLTDNFFMVKYDEMTEDVYVGLNSLFYFMELYDIEIDLKNRKIQGKIDNKNLNISFSEEESFESEGELYVNIQVLKERLPFKNIEFDFSALKLNLEPEFTLPYEKREKGKLERLRLDSRKKNSNKKIDFEMPRKLITPGLFKIGYSKYDIEDSNYKINYEYSSQLLYGELYLDGEFRPEKKINYGNLTYSNIVENNDLVLGNFSLKAPNFIDVNTKMLGVNFDSSDIYLTNDSGITIIRGEAKNVETVELYRNSFLIDYIRPFSEYYEFRIDDGVFNSNYILKIYYKDGKIEEKRVYSLSDINLLKKGKSRFVYQGGKDDEENHFQTVGKAYYGVNDNLTLGFGGMSLKSNNETEYKLFENDILLRVGNKNIPMLINYKNYYDQTHKKNNYELEIEQKLFSYNIKFVENRYAKIKNEDVDIKQYNSLSLGKNFNRNFFEIGVERVLKYDNINEESKEKNIYGIWDSSIFSPIYNSLKIERTLEGKNEKLTYRPSISYSNYEDITIILESSFSENRLKKRYDQEHLLRINLKKKELIKDSLYADLGANISYSNEREKFRYGFMFNIELDDFIYVRSPLNTIINEDGKEKTQVGVEISKIIDLSNPKRKIKKDVSLNSSWIHGKVFLDRNGNGIFDEGELPLENVKVMVNNRYFYSDKNGNYVAEGFYNNEEVALTVDRKSIDPMMKNTKELLKIKTRRSSGAKIDIPVEVISMIMGNIVYTDEFTEKEFIRSISMVTVILEKNGEIVKVIDPEFDGMYFFEDVTPGEYVIRFEYIGDRNLGFSRESIPIKILLKNPEEGEYFEGYDTKLIKLKNVKEEKMEDISEYF